VPLGPAPGAAHDRRTPQKKRAFRQSELAGVVFPVAHKQSPLHPDFTGRASIAGVDYWVMGWAKKKRDGQRYMTLRFKRRLDAPRAGAHQWRSRTEEELAAWRTRYNERQRLK